MFSTLHVPAEGVRSFYAPPRTRCEDEARRTWKFFLRLLYRKINSHHTDGYGRLKPILTSTKAVAAKGRG